MDSVDSDLSKILYLFMGWLLGLLAPLISEAVKQRRYNKELKTAIIAELVQFQFLVSGVAHLLSLQTGEYDRSFIEWRKKIVDNYTGPSSKENAQKSIDAMLSVTDGQIAEMVRRLKSADGDSLGLKSLDLPLLREKLGQLSVYPVQLQSALLEIMHRIRLVNEEVDQYRFYFKQTFSPGDGHDILKGNMQKCYKNIRVQIFNISEQIDLALTFRK